MVAHVLIRFIALVVINPNAPCYCKLSELLVLLGAPLLFKYDDDGQGAPHSRPGALEIGGAREIGGDWKQ